MGDLPKIEKSSSIYLTISIPIENVFEKALMFEMSLEKNPACENQAKLVPKEISVKQIFDYQITVERIKSKKPPIVLKKSQDYPFVHNYKLINDGPSPSNEIYEFLLYLPKLTIKDQMNVENIFDFIPDSDPKIDCTKLEDSNSLVMPEIKRKEGFESISCKSYECVAYKCKIYEKWAKGASKSVRINMNLKSDLFANANSELQEFDHFSIWTLISYEDELSGKSYISKSTDFISNRSGNWQAKIVEYWPIAVGLFVGIVVLAVVIYVTIKSGGLKKLRPYSRAPAS